MTCSGVLALVGHPPAPDFSGAPCQALALLEQVRRAAKQIQAGAGRAGMGWHGLAVGVRLGVSGCEDLWNV